jgi:competence protein ComEC
MTDEGLLVAVLDVGHGNSAILQDGADTVIVDAPQGGALVEALQGLGISQIRTAFISHADSDHFGGIVALPSLPSISVGEVRVNPDSPRRTKVFGDLRVAVEDARSRSGTQLRLEVTTELGDSLSVGRLRIEILHPRAAVAASGVGGITIDGARLSANSMSVVLRISLDDEPLLLLPGDLDEVGLNSIAAETDLSAETLVFPHHGGHPGAGSAYEFAAKLCERVRPQTVIFSLGRRRFENPRPEIIHGLRSVVPDAYVACTQLSRRCSEVVPDDEPTHLGTLPAAGRRMSLCCAGSIMILPRRQSAMAAHQNFITNFVPTPLCRATSGPRLFATIHE